jgi:GntR family transcriptional regulator, transcriptional repressor for pyruvate dehydrogenase complex
MTDVDFAAKPLNKGRVSDRVRDRITDSILQGELSVGDQLPSESELARQLGVSRVPVREAVISLEQSGLLLVKRGARGGVFVAEPSPEPMGEVLTLMLRLGRASIAELTEARLLIEPEVARLAAQRASAMDIEALRETIENYATSVDQKAPRSMADMDFHMRLAEASGNTVYRLTLQSLVSLLYNSVRERSFSQKDRRRGIGDHQAIFESVCAGDVEGASTAMTRHVKKMVTFWK